MLPTNPPLKFVSFLPLSYYHRIHNTYLTTFTIENQLNVGKYAIYMDPMELPPEPFKGPWGKTTQLSSRSETTPPRRCKAICVPVPFRRKQRTPLGLKPGEIRSTELTPKCLRKFICKQGEPWKTRYKYRVVIHNSHLFQGES